MRRFVSAACAAALSAVLAGAPALAQTQTADAVMDQMAELGIETEGLMLTEEQVLQVEAILNEASDPSDKVSRINELLGL
jgi:hypothetical protein